VFWEAGDGDPSESERVLGVWIVLPWLFVVDECVLDL